jgi:hypothetical protein
MHNSREKRRCEKKEKRWSRIYSVSTVSKLDLPELGLGCWLRATKLHAAVTLRELLNAACGIDELLLTREERMAGGADTDFQTTAGRTGVIDSATRAGNGCGLVIRMDVGFHNASRKK